jgi:hypothetical protein
VDTLEWIRLKTKLSRNKKSHRIAQEDPGEKTVWAYTKKIRRICEEGLK